MFLAGDGPLVAVDGTLKWLQGMVAVDDAYLGLPVFIRTYHRPRVGSGVLARASRVVTRALLQGNWGRPRQAWQAHTALRTAHSQTARPAQRLLGNATAMTTIRFALTGMPLE